MKQIGIYDGVEDTSLLTLEPAEDGEGKSIIDFAPLPTSAGSLKTRTELSLLTSAETSKKGVTRILVKVSLPYSGLYPSDVATGESNMKFSPNRSSGSVSAHLVLTLPKDCVQDIVQQKAGATGRECAFAHVKAVLGILDMLKLLGNGQSVGTREGSFIAFSQKPSGSDTAVNLQLPGDNFPGLTTPLLTTPETFDQSALVTLIDRCCRGYTPMADVDAVGLVQSVLH